MYGNCHISLHAICRTCLSKLQNDSAHNLFALPGLAKKLSVCTSLSVEQQDGFPKNLCNTCYTKLNDLHAFQQQCVDSVQKFKDMRGENYFVSQMENFDELHVPGREADVLVELEEERRIYDPLLNTKIEKEEDVFKMLETVDKEAVEVDKVFSNRSNSFDEDADNDELVTNDSDSDDAMPLSSLLGNKKIAKRKESGSDCSDEKRKESKMASSERLLQRAIECHICQQKFKKAASFEEHMRQHNDQLPFQCTVESCKKCFTTAAALRHHVDHAHLELCQLHPCTVQGCDKSFPRVRMLTHHLKKDHNILKPHIRVYPCRECAKVFRCPTALKKHMYKHTGEELPISCNICDKRFHINSELRIHLLRHAGVKNHVCPYCGVGKTTRQEWNKHILTHTKEKLYQCRQCDHSSHNKQALTNHVKVVHMKIKNYACQYCGKTFGKSHACKIHERLHTGENSCECKICGKLFLFEKRLTKHLQIHEKNEAVSTETSSKQKANVDGNAALNEEKEKPIPPTTAKPKYSNRVERVDMSQLAGTAVNPIPSVSVPSWSPQVNFTKKEGQHICPGCGRGFNHIGNMKLHYKVIHEKIKDFACRFCPKRFGKAQYLRHHEYTHTGEKPYGCKLCDKHFSHGSSLRKHMISHNRPPKMPKATNVDKAKDSQRPKIELNKRIPKNYEQYQDPAAERAAATAELFTQQLEGSEAKRKAEIKTRRIQRAACEQLQKLQNDHIIDGISKDSFHVESSESVEALNTDHS